MRIAIAGSHGLIGHALTQRLRWSGHEVVRLVRSEPISPDQRAWNPSGGTIEGPGLTDVDAVVNLAGAGIADARWTQSRKRDLRSSRIDTTRTITAALTESERCRVFLAGSAIGIYGDCGDRELDESSPVGDDFLAELCRDWEAEADRAPEHVRVVNLRTGHVLASTGGLIGKQALIYRLGLGGRIGDGQQWVSWISLRDHVAATEALLTAEHHGPANLVGPEPVRNIEFTKALGRVFHRPTVLPLPLPVARAAFGQEMVSTAMVASQRVRPAVLGRIGHQFQDTTVDQALTHLFG
ncbi:TIGR01777 family oxidoreductase [Aestuariimicrobium sp. T2.26MG-19.2B]|uniref:TIGR01777 family oxidoreductase n=1 Tax=Aestuariimicrobium sp. T2.26MG-19.2B TaxID=3040679 RepID=UPI002477AEF1|nr:TIGR01777 family oxidoreductase [Aestuariimicrobium sp. T2.26MG-19.2B]CAI9405136.1 Epimerase family protein [Aestuariimicrobium sp. T2.26MG-19.2B]